MDRSITWLWIVPLLPALAAGGEVPGSTQALQRLEERLDRLQQQMEEKDRRINELEAEVQSLKAEPRGPDDSREALEEAVRQLEKDRAAAEPDGLVTVPIGGGSQFRLMDISLDVLFAVGASTEGDESLQTLQGGAHDPRKRGFTLQQAELSFTGAIDPYLYGEAHIIFSIDPIEGETITELEEAFVQTQTLPWGLQVEAGYFFTEFGLINPRHPHEWFWLDQPVILTRILGPEGLRQAGVRLGWLTPLPWYSELHFGVQNSDGHTAASFRGAGLGGHGHGHGEEEEEHFEEGIGGRPIVERDTRSLADMLYLMRWVNGWDLNDELSMQVGASALFGPNNTGSDTDTWVYGGDLLLKYRPLGGDRGWPFVIWQTEAIGREFEAAAFADPDEGIFIPADDLTDWGFYTQVLYGFTRPWAAGLRYEFASGGGPSYEEGERISRNDDPFRDDRHRISPLILWQPTEFSRFRLQYNYDMAAHLDGGDAHTIWFGVEFLFGAHPAHTY